MSKSNRKILQIKNLIDSKEAELEALKTIQKDLRHKFDAESSKDKVLDDEEKEDYNPKLKQIKVTTFFQKSEEKVLIQLRKRPVDEDHYFDIDYEEKKFDGEDIDDAGFEDVLEEMKEERKEDTQGKTAHISWGLATKSRVLAMLKSESVLSVFKTFQQRIPLRTIFQWKKNGKATRKQGSGRKLVSHILDTLLFQWFIKQRARKLSVSEEDLCTQAQKIQRKLLERPDTENKEKLSTMVFANGWIDRFKKRYSIRRRKVSTWSKKLASAIRKEVEKFYPNFDEVMIQNQIKHVLNIDESAVFFEMNQNSTLDVAGQKVTGIFSTGANKQRCTLLIGILSDGKSGSSLPPIIILKNSNAPKTGRIFTFSNITKKQDKESIQMIKNLVAQKKLLLLENKSGWNNAYLMTNYIISFLASSLTPEVKERTLLLLDNCSSHTEETVFNELSKKFSTLYFPPDCTPILQPVDISVGKSLKTFIRKAFHQHVRENFDEIVKPDGRRKKTFKNPSKIEIINWILGAYKTLKVETINSGFIEAGLLGENIEERRKNLFDNKIKKFYVDNDFNYENLLAYPLDPNNNEIVEILQVLEDEI